jgi:hypothetical protein
MNVTQSLFRSVKFLQYHLNAFTAHKLHSPFVYDLYTNVISDSTSFYSFERIEAIRAKMFLSGTEIAVDDFGTGERFGTSPAIT